VDEIIRPNHKTKATDDNSQSFNEEEFEENLNSNQGRYMQSLPTHSC
jgi:hypothetical protein